MGQLARALLPLHGEALQGVVEQAVRLGCRGWAGGVTAVNDIVNVCGLCGM